LFAGQMIGTFLVFLIVPEVAFRDGNPLLLTVEGEFVIKNLVLLAAGMVIGSRVQAVGARKAGRPYG
jgi:putative oxidoreductase